jgi:hypothetical protein
MKPYHLRSNPIVHGDKVSHHPNNTGILVNLMDKSLSIKERTQKEWLIPYTHTKGKSTK